MLGKLDDDDRKYLRVAVELSRSYRDDPRRWPFGAILVGQGKILGQGFNQVVELRDPSAHAEIMALRAAGRALGRHVFEDCVLYSSGEPCPMCLAACYWASIPRVVFAVTTHELACVPVSASSVTSLARSKATPPIAELPDRRADNRTTASGECYAGHGRPARVCRGP